MLDSVCVGIRGYGLLSHSDKDAYRSFIVNGNEHQEKPVDLIHRYIELIKQVDWSRATKKERTGAVFLAIRTKHTPTDPSTWYTAAPRGYKWFNEDFRRWQKAVGMARQETSHAGRKTLEQRNKGKTANIKRAVSHTLKHREIQQSVNYYEEVTDDDLREVARNTLLSQEAPTVSQTTSTTSTTTSVSMVSNIPVSVASTSSTTTTTTNPSQFPPTALPGGLLGQFPPPAALPGGSIFYIQQMHVQHFHADKQ